MKSTNTIEVVGGTARQKELAFSIAAFVIQKFLPRYRTLDIVIKLTSLKSSGVKGFALAYDCHRKFEVEVEQTLGLKELMTTVAHELVHVKQYVLGDLDAECFAPSAGEVLWRGGELDTTNMDYWDYPWEIEAHGREKGLFIQWARTHGIDHKPGKWMEK